MILPTKYLTEDQTFLGVGATLLENLKTPKSLSKLWDVVKNQENIGTFERFILGLDILYMLGIIIFYDGKIKKTRS